jgi:alkanesulfonate monooxygenase SsuD/methylene tetrahydromethanopterin reductase-like flavin-dependent oxidoreductase (luciferase family)
MSGHDRRLQFGLAVSPVARGYEGAVAMARCADEAGLDLVGVPDHPYSPGELDALSFIASLIPQTSRVRLFTNVANLPLRPPATLAKVAASLDAMSSGRFELGIGVGSAWKAIGAMGGAVRTGGEAVDALEEAIEVARRIWSGERPVSFDGEHHALRGWRPGSAPAHDIGIWVGALGPRMLRLTGRLADGWSASLPAYFPYERLKAAQKLIDEGAHQAGRNPSEILRIYNVPGTIDEALPGQGQGPPRGSEPLRGTSEYWVETLAGWALELGFDSFVFWPERPSPKQVDLFAKEVVPVVREAVEKEGSRA